MLPLGAVGGHGEGVDEFTWAAPQDFTGDIGVQIVISVPSRSFCLTTASVSGRFTNASENPMKFLVSMTDSTTRNPSAAATFTFSQGVHEPVYAYAFGLADTRNRSVEFSGRWAWIAGAGVRTDSIARATVLGYDLEHWDNDLTSAPFSVNVTCTNEFRVGSIVAGREGTSFSTLSMDGGAGAGAREEATGFAASVQALDHIAIDNEEEAALLTTRMGAFSSAPCPASLAAAVMPFDYPNGSSILWSADCYLLGYTDLVQPSGPGIYRLSVNRASYGSSEWFFGSLMGVRDVASLDEILT